MRKDGKFGPVWTDYAGKQWPVIVSNRRLKFGYPAHAALRAHVFRRDGYKCVRCSVAAIEIPVNYCGRRALFTDSRVKSGYRDVLVLDHILTLRAGGTNTVDNFQALCETCNKRKQSEDKLAALAHGGAV